MRKLYFKAVMLLAGVLFMLGNSSVSAQMIYVPTTIDELFAQEANKYHFSLMPRTDSILKPTTMILSDANSMEPEKAEFTPMYKTVETYDKKNNLTLQERFFADPDTKDFILREKCDFTYDSKNRPVGAQMYYLDLDDNKWYKGEKTIVEYNEKGEYDPTLVDYKAFNRETGKWDDVYSDNRAIECEFDKEGRVNRITRFNDYNRDEDSKITLDFEYEKGKENPVRMKLTQMAGGQAFVIDMYDIVWHKCNNMFLRMCGNVTDLFEGDPNNILANCTMTMQGFDGIAAKVENKFKNDTLVHRYYYTMGQYEICDKEYGTDENGKYSKRIMERGTADLSTNEKNPSDGQVCVIRYDENNQVKEISLSNPLYKDDPARVYGFDLEYNKNKEVTSRIMFQYDETKTKKNYLWKQEFSGFKDSVPTGIAEVKDSRNATVSYRNGVIFVTDAEGAPYSIVSIEGAACMNGRVNGGRISTDALAPGMYIAKVNGTAVKFVVR